MVDWNNVGDDKGRFTLHEDGHITWQADKTNPLPGDAVASIQKGQAQLSPDVVLINAETIDDAQKSDIKTKITTWVQSYLKEVLAPLFRLVDETENKLAGSVKGIGFQLY